MEKESAVLEVSRVGFAKTCDATLRVQSTRVGRFSLYLCLCQCVCVYVYIYVSICPCTSL